MECHRPRGSHRGEARMKALILTCLAVAAALAADQATLDRGQKEESRSCLPCHSLRLIHSQRLSKAAWNKELDKMTARCAGARARAAGGEGRLGQEAQGAQV